MKGNKKKLEHLNSEFDEENSNESSLNSLNSNKINYKKKETNLDNIDINENIDLEYEIKIPKFMINFENFSKLCTQLKNTDDDSEGEDNQTTRTYLDDSDDNSSLIQKPQVSHKFLRKATTAKNKSNSRACSAFKIYSVPCTTGAIEILPVIYNSFIREAAKLSEK
jgi:hypothetical protein